MKSPRGFLFGGMMLVLSLLGGVGAAHHSRSYFSTTLSTISGTVVELKWRNPHIILVFDVKEDDGKVVQWTGELASIQSALAGGMTKDAIKPGDEIIVDGFKTKPEVGTPQCQVLKITKKNGTVVLRSSETVEQIEKRREGAVK